MLRIHFYEFIPHLNKTRLLFPKSDQKLLMLFFPNPIDLMNIPSFKFGLFCRLV
jgi:hypothetical protein